MKKLLVLVLLAAFSGFAAAEDLGIEAGAEVGFGDIADEAVLTIAPLVKYAKTIDALNIALKLQYYVEFADPDTVQTLYFEPEFTYTLPAGPGSLALALYGENYFFIDPSSDMAGMIEPGVKYNQAFDFGDLSAKFALPLTYEPESAMDMYITLGYGKDGFGLELTGYYNMDPLGELSGYEALLSYEKDNYYAEVVIGTDKEFGVYTVSPYGELYLGKVTVWAGADFGNLGDSDLDVSIVPYIGGTYKF